MEINYNSQSKDLSGEWKRQRQDRRKMKTKNAQEKESFCSSHVHLAYPEFWIKGKKSTNPWFPEVCLITELSTVIKSNISPHPSNIMAIARVLRTRRAERMASLVLTSPWCTMSSCIVLYMHGGQTLLVLTVSVSHLCVKHTAPYAFVYYNSGVNWIKQSPIGWQLF